jgi:carbamoyltransferase
MATHVLGVSAFFHDSAACLLRDGEIVFAVEEERLSRVKHDHAWPERAIAACLEAGGVAASDVDAVVFYEKTLPKLERQIDTWLRGWPRSSSAFVRSMSRWLDGRLDLARWMALRAGFRREILFSEHHLSHAAFAFLASPFEAASVLVVDGVGEHATTSVWSAGPEGLVAEREIRFPDSLGLFYAAITGHLGFRVNEDEYKVMGLASYGRDAHRDAMAAILPAAEGGAFRLDRAYVDPAGRERLARPAMDALLGPPRAPGGRIEARHEDLARSAQVRLEEALLAIEETLPPGRPLAMAGGVALNGAANALLARRRPLFVPFAPGDSGAAIGAAFVGSYLAGIGPRPARPRITPYLGPAFDRAACEAAARAAGLEARPLADLGGDARVADALVAGAIVGFFDGRMEFGPRALGARSILADPRRAETRDVVNARIKHREPFRPFAPAILEERAADWFEDARPVPYMQEILVVRPERRAAIAAVVHVDGTGRLQTVSARETPRFHALIEAFGARTGVPVLLNTSFNVAGEPIVATPEDACRCFRAADLDALVLGELWIERPLRAATGVRASIAAG